MKAVIIAGLFLYPTLLLAQDTGLIPCSGVDCQACHLVELGQNILKWLITIMISVIGVIFAIAGMLLVTSGANEGNITKAKSMMTNAIIGLIILLAAWLIVDTILKIFVNEAKVGPWNSVQCVAQPEYNTNPSGGPGGVGTTTPADPTIPLQCNDDQALMQKYGGSPVGLEAPGLRSMINCYLEDPAVAALVDENQIYTVERTNPRCSLTNGNRACGPCQHSVNSCHYGRGSGDGAKAVDFNAIGDEERKLYQLLQNNKARCGGSILFENNHTHISLPGC